MRMTISPTVKGTLTSCARRPKSQARLMSAPRAPEVPDDAPKGRRLRSVGTRASQTSAQAVRHVDRLRQQHELLDAALEAGDLDRRRAGSLLAGGIAFRLFFWLLPAALIVAGAVGFFKPSGSAQPAHVARTLGLGASVAAIVRHATTDAQKGAGVLLALGIVSTLYMSMSLVRSLRIAHVLAWEEPFGRRPHLLRDGALVSLALILAFAGEAAAQYLRHRTGVGLSLLLSLVPVVLGGCLWIAVSLLLPHAEARWRALLPGAALFAIGVAALHLATVFYFAPRLARAPTLYGSLGTAATLLVWLFVVSRIIVASAFLNATRWRRSAGSAHSHL
jgi:uncharacterized BrkB/YihY/UPF0761 family membrane protein